MNSDTEKADIVDAIHENIAYLLIAAAMVLSCELLEQFVGTDAAHLVRYALWLLVGIGGLVLLRIGWLVLGKWRKGEGRSSEEFSFTSHIMYKAATASWIVGILITSLDNKLFSAIPTAEPIQFMSQSIQAATFLTYGIAFLALNRDAGEAD